MSDDLDKMIQSMKNNPPSSLRRVCVNTSSLFLKGYNKSGEDTSSEDIIIDIPRTTNFQGNLLSYPSVYISEEEKKFVKNCIEAKKLCSVAVFKFKILNSLIKFIIGSINIIIAIMIVYHPEKRNVIISLAVSGGFSILIESLFDWSKMVEKYSYLYNAFDRLSRSSSSTKYEHFKELVLRYEESYLFIDSFNDNESIKILSSNRFRMLK
jgi:hypothetical protein